MPENDFQVIEVQEGFIRDAAGNPVPGFKVYFTWGDGHKGMVEMQKGRASRERRDLLIEEEIAQQDALWG